MWLYAFCVSIPYYPSVGHCIVYFCLGHTTTFRLINGNHLHTFFLYITHRKRRCYGNINFHNLMDVNLPIWQQILSDIGLKKLGFKNGPTIPFLIGVYHHLGVLSFDELQNDTCLRKIFKEVLMSGDGIIGVTYCKDLDAKIVRRAQLDSHNTITLCNCEEYISQIWREYGKYIQTCRFSCDRQDNAWREFNQEELENICWIKA